MQLLVSSGDLFESDFCLSLYSAKERILSNLQKHPAPLRAPELQEQKAPVADVPTACLSDSKAAAKLLQQDLSILQSQARYVEIIFRVLVIGSVF